MDRVHKIRILERGRPLEVRTVDDQRRREGHALDGGPDGLDAYRALAEELPSVLVPGGAVVLELGIGQAASVAALFERAGSGGWAAR